MTKSQSESQKNILITGGTGSLGKALVRYWYGKHNLTILSRDWHKQAAMTAEYPDNRYILADVCNYDEVERACEGQDILIHAAAAKDVGTGEYHPVEFARVNIQGSLTAATAWRRTHTVLQPGLALLISSDKATQAINAYGKSKGVAEAIFRKHDYSAIRYGNVIESAGSFVQRWQEAIARGESITVREPAPTRFILMMPDAIALIVDALRLAETENGIFVPHNLKAFSIRDVAIALGAGVKYESLLPYEKQHESLVAEGEKAIIESDLLARIRPGGWSGEYRRYQSNRAEMLSGEQVLEMLGWNPAGRE